HPSVIMYSIGNEIPDVGQPSGAVWGRRLAERIRALDPTRFITNGVNALLGCGPALLDSIREEVGDGDVNTLMSALRGRMSELMLSDIVTESTAESFAVLDVAG